MGPFGNLFGLLLVVVAIFMILLVLVQRGRGGGLAGALGGMGGQSAFGTKAGDLFTRITMAAAFVWILLCIIAAKWLTKEENVFDKSLGGSASSRVEAPPVPGKGVSDIPATGATTPPPVAPAPAPSTAPSSPASGSGAPAPGAAQPKK